jgi:hypothetical protein
MISNRMNRINVIIAWMEAIVLEFRVREIDQESHFDTGCGEIVDRLSFMF